MAEKMMAGTYRVNQDGIEVCNRYHMTPREIIPWLSRELDYAQNRAEVAEHTLALAPNKPFVVTLEELKDTVRGIVKVEGVNLSPQQKEFFKELFAAVLQEIKAGGESENKK